MSHTNHTQHYNLPQYAGSDIINPLVDTNGAYEVIDTTMHNIAAEAAQGTADIGELQSKVGSGVFDTTAQNATDAVNEVVGELNTADTGIKARLATAESDIDTLQSQMVTAQGNITNLQNNKANQNEVDGINTKIGTGEPTTTDKTLIGAINELNAKTLTGYVVEGTHLVSAAHDGAKTYKELAAILKTGVESLLNNHEALMIGNIQITGVGSIPNANMAYVVKSTNISNQNVRGSLSVINSDKDYQFAIDIPFDDTSNTSYRQSTFDGTTRAFSDLSNTVADHDLSLMIVALDPNEFT